MSQETTPLTSSDDGSDPSRLVLVVDDLPDNVTVVRMMLERRGFRVITAQDGAEAVDLARRLRPDIILMDIGMPGTDGLEAALQIKRDPQLRRVPIVAVTAFNTGGFRRAAWEAGFDGYLAKPFDAEQAIYLIKKLLER
ncbi:MAG: hypothetical protein C4334_01630 [Pyrinomonas sp.]|uniref:response regulator n=1 Tax=Pyrinomonas sp. TaxID=2080306 RepID=UPI0033272D1F